MADNTARNAASPPGKGEGSSIVDKVLDGPLTGLAPWIFLAIFEGPGSTGWVSAVALAISVFFVVADRIRGKQLKILGAVDVLFFAGLFILHFFLSVDGQVWLEKWIGEIANITLVIIAVGSILIRVPFTLQYARDMVEPEYWNSPLFIKTNYIITAVWAAAFAVAAAAGWYGDAVLDDSNNIWTGWVLQTGAMVCAIKFTAWYPDHVSEKAIAEHEGAETGSTGETL
ncbi:hypothetical protein [Rhodococcus artemisiae]|uniref:Intracellular septation protein A n=1 Tax=Rhodococcus artemisiae TaxID=714159 RepID=A0ABU7LGW4_9NOCA|nr:hypothetical protein [Rhodococcus artemisiae]MEE2060800.1 hypothetical protein [Rhodococcus artemisiae]